MLERAERIVRVRGLSEDLRFVVRARIESNSTQKWMKEGTELVQMLHIT